MLAAATLLLLASPFLVGTAVGRWRPANRFVARHYWPSLFIGWTGVVLLLTGLLDLSGPHSNLAGLIGGPLAGLSFWSRRDGGDDGGDDPEDDPSSDGGLDWDEFARDFAEYVAANDRRPTLRSRLPS